MSKALKYIFIIVAGFILLLAFLLIFTQTQFFRDKAKEQLIKVVENQLNLKLEIEDINGNLFNNLSIEGVALSEGDSTVAFFSSLKLDYNLLLLTDKIISIDSLILESPTINLSQKNDSSWNFSYYIKPKRKIQTRKKKSFDYLIDVNHVAIKEGNISISSKSKIIPANVRKFNINAGVAVDKKQIKIHLKNSGFQTENPSIALNNLSGFFTKNQNGIQIDSLLLITDQSNLNFNGEYLSIENFNTRINTSKIDKNELKLFIPTFKLLCSPSVRVEFNTKNDTVSARAKLDYKNQSVIAKISFNPLSKMFDKNQTIPYLIDLTFNKFQVENWIEFNTQQSLLAGNIKIKGDNLLDKKSLSTITANLENSKFSGISFDRLNLTGDYLNDSLVAIIDAQTDFGNLLLNGNIWNIREIPKYKATLKTSNLNLTSIIPKLLNTKINANIELNGSGIKAPDYKIDAFVHLYESSIYNFPVDSLETNAVFHNSQIVLNSLQFKVPGGSVKGKGQFNIDSLFLETQVQVKLDSLSFLDSTYIVPIEFKSITANSELSGPVSELKLNGNLQANQLKGYSIELEDLNASFSSILKKDSFNMNVNTFSKLVETGPIVWDSIMANVEYTNSEIAIDFNGIWNDTINAKFKTQIKLTDTISVTVPKLEINTLFSDYYLGDTLIATLTKSKDLNVQNLILKDYNRPDFNLSMQGDISTTDINNFEVLINQLDLSQINKFIEKEDSLKGFLNTEIVISGTAEKPIIDGLINVTNPKYGNNGFTALTAKIDYNNQKGKAEITTPDLGTSFYISASAPFKAYFDSLKFIFAPPETFEAQLVIDSLNVSQAIEKRVENDTVNGVLNANIKANGDISNPLFYGSINLEDGHFVDNNRGINYNHIKTSVAFDGKKITLDTLLIKQNAGLISATGEIEFDSTIIKGNIVSSSITADASNFFITKHRNYELQIDANTFIKTGTKNPEFGGKIKVLRSDLFLPAIISGDRTDNDLDNVPMLVEALYNENDSAALLAITYAEKSKKIKNQSALLDNLTGKLNIEIYRNTWLKSDDMRLELRGEVDVVKSGPFFELFGNVDIVRGHYILYGKKLIVKESEIIFQGGEELDPTLNLNAEYTYRGSDKEKRTLELLVSGILSEPEILFYLDGSELTETDAVSILIFGKTSDELGYDGQNGLVGSIGSSAVASVISSQLSKTLGSQFNLDMIEVNATENWQSAAFVVGKYITNDLFVIYQRGFGEVEGDEITPETITIEYELNKNLFLRLQSGSSKTSGLDVILKFEKKRTD